MISFLEHLVFWHWWVLAITLVILEILAPGVIFLWLGIGAGITGLLLLAVSSLDWQVQLVIFASISVMATIGGRMWWKRNSQVSDHPLLNQRGAQYIGRTFTLNQAIINGTGKVRVGDSDWRINGSDMPAGSHVKVTGTAGASLIVEKASDNSNRD